MAQPDLQQPCFEIPPLFWESSPWVPEDRAIEEPRRLREAPLRLSDEHLVEASLAGDSIRAQR